MSLNKLPLLDAEKIKGVEIDDSAIADLRALVFRSPSGKIEYVDLSGGGDMLKEVYDTDLNNIIDNAEKLAGYTLAEVRDHTLDIAKITGIVPVGQGGLGKTFVPSWLNDYIIVYNLSEDRFEMVAKPEAGGGLESCVEVSAGDMSDLQSKVANYWGSKKIIVPSCPM